MKLIAGHYLGVTGIVIASSIVITMILLNLDEWITFGVMIAYMIYLVYIIHLLYEKFKENAKGSRVYFYIK